jgi:hypothetical protein
MSSDDLETYEAELRLQLYREYRDVTRMFRYVVETERGVYLANEVESRADTTAGRARVVLVLRDAWVWDMYRQQRFVPHVQIVTFRDVVIEEVAHEELDLSREGFAGAGGDQPSPTRREHPAGEGDRPDEPGPEAS